MQPIQPKPGAMSSEFWSVAGIVIATLLVKFLHVPNSDAEGVATSIMSFAASGAVVWQYIRSRTALKSPPVPVPPKP